jgi:hypothetical protein
MESNTHKKNLQLVARCGMLRCSDVVKILRETVEVHFKISENTEFKAKDEFDVHLFLKNIYIFIL